MLKAAAVVAPQGRGASARFQATALVALFAIVCAGCGGDRRGAQAQTSAESLDTTIPEVLATIGSEQVTVQDLRPVAGDQLDQLDMQYSRARSKIIEDALAQVLRDRVLTEEARKQGTTTEQLILAEAGGVTDPSDVEIAAWYADNQARLGGRPLAEVKAQIAQHLRDERWQQAQTRLEDRLRAERNVVVKFAPFRFQISETDAPSKGPKSAPVTVVEFSDFECPFCARFATTFQQIASEFGDDVRIVYRQFPITSIHPAAFKAAEASLCAHEQDKFWQLHDAMFANQQKLAVSDLKVTARQLGLDGRKFDNCLDSGRFTEQVQNDIKEGSRLGVTGTPAVFVNGVLLEGGAVGFDVAAAAIRKELESAKR